MSDAALRELARRAGLALQWTNYAGKNRTVSLDAIRRILPALGLPCGSASDLAASNQALANTKTPTLITATVRQKIELPIRRRRGRIRARLVLEDGSATDIAVTETRQGLRVPAVDVAGYHTLEIGDMRLTLAVAPVRCHTIEEIAPGERIAGLAAQTYALRHPTDCGIGDMAGVEALATAAAALGVETLALSPAHALFAADPGHSSPYSPSSRLFYNPLLADASALFGAARVGRARTAAGLGDAVRQLEASDLIDWNAAGRAKLAVLRCLFDDFAATDLTAASSELAGDFTNFCSDRGPALAAHGLFETLHQARLQGDQTARHWRDWPAGFRDPDGAAVRSFAQQNGREISFHLFLQWIADRSFAHAQYEVQRSGMRIGLITDLAVGINSGGSQAWAGQNDVLVGLEIGAPPDLFNANGQSWGLTTFSPRALLQAGFAPFIAMLRASMRHAGGVRIDHAMGFKHLWITPQGAKPSEGTYLAYPLDDLLRLTALESHRHRVVVIAEDLGTVAAGFHERLEHAGIYGMRVLWFERGERTFTPPRKWPAHVAGMTSTHDLPTVAGWWRGSDLQMREENGLLGDPEAEQAAREKDRGALWKAFCTAGLAEGPPPGLKDTSRVADAAVGFIAQTPSRLALLPLEDALGTEQQPNLPGTIDEHPNWRRRYVGDAGALLEPRAVRHRVNLLTRRDEE